MITITNNNIYNNTADYELWNDREQETSDVDATNNWWGTTDETAIGGKIYDFTDDNSRGNIEYSPYETHHIIDAPISPPANFTATAVIGGEINLNWKANDEPDISGYKVYLGTDGNYSYSGSMDVGNVTSYIITGLSNGTYFVSVTAYDTDYTFSSEDPDTIVNDNMTNGNESWYAEEQEVKITDSTEVPTSPSPSPSPTVTPTDTDSTLVGRVSDTVGPPIAGATVSTDTGGFSTTTGSDGIYALAVVSGSYTVTASATGFESAFQPITAAAGINPGVDFTLTSETICDKPANIGADPRRLRLNRQESGDITITVICEDGTPVAGETVTAKLNRRAQRRLDLTSSDTAVTDANGEATFTVEAERRVGRVRVKFTTEDGLRRIVRVRIRR